MLNGVYAVASSVFCFALFSFLPDGLVALTRTLSGEVNGFGVIDRILDMSVDDCRKECGRQMSCAHVVYERRYHLCTLLEGPETPPVLTTGFVVASKANGNIVVGEFCQHKIGTAAFI